MTLVELPHSSVQIPLNLLQERQSHLTVVLPTACKGARTTSIPSYAHPEFLVTVDELDGLLAQVVSECSMSLRLHSRDNVAEELCFNEGHIPGSVFFDVASAKGAYLTKGRSPVDVANPEHVTEQLRQVGVNEGDRWSGCLNTPAWNRFRTMWCTRAWWTLHHMGVDVAILHGGVEGWVASGRPRNGPVTAERQHFCQRDRARAGNERRCGRN